MNSTALLLIGSVWAIFTAKNIIIAAWIMLIATVLSMIKRTRDGETDELPPIMTGFIGGILMIAFSFMVPVKENKYDITKEVKVEYVNNSFPKAYITLFEKDKAEIVGFFQTNEEFKVKKVNEVTSYNILGIEVGSRNFEFINEKDEFITKNSP